MKKALFRLHPFFFALYPILELRNYNITFVDSAALLRPILLAVLFACIVWFLLRLFTREWKKSGILTTLVVIAFFSYGHVFIQIETLTGDMIRHRYLILIYAVLLLTAGWLVITRLKIPDAAINFLTATGALLFVFSAVRSAGHDIAENRSAQEIRKAQESFLQDARTGTDTSLLPDIYLILLDAHTSEYTLREAFGYDNSAFTQELEGMGFYVAECAQSNYPVTNLSVTSAFQADYHRTPTLYPLYSSLAIETLRAQGYELITFQNRSHGHFSLGEDQRLSRNQLLLGPVDLTGGLSEFDFMLIQTSFLRIAFDMPQLLPWFNVQSPQEIEYYEHYQQTYFILDELKRLPQRGGPKFVFAHLLVPHSPFIFTPVGDFLWADDPSRDISPTSNSSMIRSHRRRQRLSKRRIFRLLSSSWAITVQPGYHN
ncbi:MAG TPA: hypothetical protein VMJ90_00350 [Anaerolineales bacterium]|nr:hypothetical protein [Anaerolineales bacterium]